MAGLLFADVMMTLVRRTRKPRAGDERGVAIIYLALFLTVLMIMAAIVVDVGNARQQRANAQSAVDAGALSAAQILVVTQPSQATNVFNMAANTAYNSMFMHPNFSAPTGTCTATGVGAVCNDYGFTASGVKYDVQVTTPYQGPDETKPDTSMLNVTACWSVPAVFGRVVGTNSIPICATATAQNGVATGGPSHSGCGNQTELTNITNNFSNPSGPYTISATYNTTAGTGLPIDQSKVHFVVQTQWGNFIELSATGNGVSQPGVSYGMLPVTGGNNVTLSYTLPSTILPNGAAGSAYSTTFSANLEVTDTAGRNCGNAAWSTCNPGAHDPIFDGGSSHDVGTLGWGLDGQHSVTDDTADHDGNDLNSTADADDTVTPQQGSTINAGNAIGAIYNDEWPLRAASVALVVDGAVIPYNQAWNSNTFTFTDPTTMTSSGSGTPSVVTGMPSFGTVDPNVSTATSGGGGARITLLDTMGNPMPDENVAISGVAGSQVTALNGQVEFTSPSSGSHTVSYSWAGGAGSINRGSGSFTITVTSGGSVSKTTSPAADWPNNGHDNGVGGSLSPGQSVGVMYKTPTSFLNGWHSAVLFANDGDVTTTGGDCSIIAWAFASTGGVNGPGTLHLVL
jgi:Flp pilus assembly protein TadG